MQPRLFSAFFLGLAATTLWAQPAATTPTSPPVHLTLAQKEVFLKTAKVLRSRGAKKGITGTVRVTLSDGTLTHDASVQRIDEEKARFEGLRGTEMNFRDTYKFNIAGYRVGLLLGLGDMIPPSVERKFEGSSGAWTWWVDDVLIDEGERIKKKMDAPDKDAWGKQYHIMRVFDQLIANTDRNVGNLLYDKEWHLWLIDHGRAFRALPSIYDRKMIERCDKQFLANMKKLTEPQLKAEAGDWLRDREIKGLLARRDKIVDHFEKGDPAKLYVYLDNRR